MRTENEPLAPAALFLFAHQDDEFGIFQKIVDELHAGSHVCCAYLTQGGHSNSLAERRNLESLSVLSKLGVSNKDIFFAGDTLRIRDGKLLENLDLASSWIQSWWSNYPQIRSLYVPAWEGGHPDHDALHAITVRTAQKNNILSLARQFSLYNGYRCIGPLFRVLLPIPLNGLVESRPISWKNRLRFLRHCLSYPSQIRTWIGLLPFVFLHYMVFGVQNTQLISLERIKHRPHAKRLYYERRKFCTWENMANRLSDRDDRSLN
ncbi:PIG-L deacetylase family protein [Candidatus Skiveiella danica]|uniref:PIG-L deacetylase family protein n=1 Tax=Candidatus Skiveiella danica TaxID=3386177 RepID=UPI001DEF9C87|nr:PIG-L family deacetylase [Betaproteobacteria bacterium]